MGTLGTVSLAIIAGLWLGFAGTKGNAALSAGLQKTGSAIGLLKEEAIAASNIQNPIEEKSNHGIMNWLKAFPLNPLSANEPTSLTNDNKNLPNRSIRPLNANLSGNANMPGNYNGAPDYNAQGHYNGAPDQQSIPEMIKNSGSGNVTIFY
jgi:hypothetical protein